MDKRTIDLKGLLSLVSLSNTNFLLKKLVFLMIEKSEKFTIALSTKISVLPPNDLKTAFPKVEVDMINSYLELDTDFRFTVVEDTLLGNVFFVLARYPQDPTTIIVFDPNLLAKINTLMGSADFERIAGKKNIEVSK